MKRPAGKQPQPEPNYCHHLTLDQVREIHAGVLDAFGGSEGVRDIRLLESAVAAAQATMFGKSVFGDLIEIAGAYLFYLCKNHPFLDGNKRTAMTAAIVFLRINGIEPAADNEAWEHLVMDVAGSKLDREATTVRLRELTKSQRMKRS